MNSFGNIYRLTSFGESHGPAMGGVIDGVPAGVEIDLGALRSYLSLRSPGKSKLTSPRKEPDSLRILSGMMGLTPEGELTPLSEDTEKAVTLGTSIGFMVENVDHRSKDYGNMKDVFRPSHADYAWFRKYGVRDWRGGGRSSGRETVSRVVAGGMAIQMLASLDISFDTRVVEVGGVSDPSRFAEVITAARNDGDSVGGVVECVVKGVEPGLGEPVFGKLQQMLGSAFFSIGAVKGVEFGMGFAGAGKCGSEVADLMIPDEKRTYGFMSNNSGGIQGGISNGEPIVMRVAFKPTPTLSMELQTVDKNGESVSLKAHGRHDPCIAIRGRIVVEAMAAMVVLDAYLMAKTNRL